MTMLPSVYTIGVSIQHVGYIRRFIRGRLRENRLRYHVLRFNHSDNSQPCRAVVRAAVSTVSEVTSSRR